MSVNKVVLNGETIIDLSNDTVSEDSVVQGYTFHDKDGVAKVGTRNPYSADFMPEGNIDIVANAPSVDVFSKATANVDVKPKYETKGSTDSPVTIPYGETTEVILIPDNERKNGYAYRAVEKVYVKSDIATGTKEISQVTIAPETITQTEAITEPIDVSKVSEAKLKQQIKTVDFEPSEGEKWVSTPYIYSDSGYAGMYRANVHIDMSNFMKIPNITKTLTVDTQGEKYNVRDYYYVTVQLKEYDGSVSISALSYVTD